MKILAILLLGLMATKAPAADWRYTTVSGAGNMPLNVVSVGNPENPGILLVHGMGQSHYSFKKQLDSDLAEDFYLVSFDLRGHGGSGKPWTEQDYAAAEIWSGDVIAVMNAMGLERPVMVAWSYGTIVAMDFTRIEGQEKLAGLVLTGGVGGLVPPPVPSLDEDMAKQSARRREMQLSGNPADNFRASDEVVDILSEGPVSPEDRKVFRAVGTMLPAYARRAMTGRNFNNQDLRDSLRLPVLIALGETDFAMTTGAATDFVGGHPNFKLSLYSNSGHSVFYEQAERFNRELRVFSEQVIPGR